MNTLRSLFFVILFTAVLFPYRAECAEPTVLEKAIVLHDRACDGDGKAAEKAVGLFTKMIEAEPKNAVAVAYLGSSYALMGRHSDVLNDKVRYTNRGIRFLDQSLQYGADNFTVRVIRAHVNLSLPAMFKRADAARADIEKLDSLYMAAPSQEHAQQVAPLYAQLAKSLNGDSRWMAKSRAAASVAAQKR